MCTGVDVDYDVADSATGLKLGGSCGSRSWRRRLERRRAQRWRKSFWNSWQKLSGSRVLMRA